jgi:uncharacterized protein YjiS (DUF1127 family)
MLRNDALPSLMSRFRTTARRLLHRERRRRQPGAVASIVFLWLKRSRSRRALARLDEHQLRDIGLSRADAWREGMKPFWRP